MHRIRLRGPWDCEPLSSADGGPVPQARRMTLPCRWDAGGLLDFAGRVRYTRRFGMPTNLSAEESVWLVFEGVEGSANVSLNGTALGSHGHDEEPFGFEVTPLLKARNELQVDVESRSSSGGIWGEVVLEIRSRDS